MGRTPPSGGTERYKIILAYHGAAFSGMQRQARHRSVQAVLEEALRALGWAGRAVLFAGRTDAGVHASGQVAAFDLQWRHSSESLLKALNTQLPADVAVQAVEQVGAQFHPRYDARKRTYRYRLYCQPQRDPLREGLAWRVWPAPRLRRLQAAARHLRGEHDFVAFGPAPQPGGHTVRTVHAARWQQAADDEFIFEVTANAFLYHMVRRMVGLQVKAGQGLIEPEVVHAALRSQQRVRQLAPAHGLTLVHVEY
ncbi:MAG: tRNA pseudouridine(38-40) synthase TruA [Anaerolineales bacterium]|nr:tRNA pseudouridine(38-40) synthase TruA [Anaerolineales bacterium]